jgi:hypothetical protein
MAPRHPSDAGPSRRRVLALPAAALAAALPAPALADADGATPLQELIDRHEQAAAAFEAACSRLDGVEQAIAQAFPAPVCRAWLGEAGRKQWREVRRTHGVDKLERDRARLDEAEKEHALALLACPCRSDEEARRKGTYLRQSDIIRESLSRDERFIDALLTSLVT